MALSLTMNTAWFSLPSRNRSVSLKSSSSFFTSSVFSDSPSMIIIIHKQKWVRRTKRRRERKEREREGEMGEGKWGGRGRDIVEGTEGEDRGREGGSPGLFHKIVHPD